MSKIVTFIGKHWIEQHIKQLEQLNNTDDIGHWQAVAIRTMLKEIRNNPHREIYDKVYEKLMRDGDIKCAMQVLHLSGLLSNGEVIDFKLKCPPPPQDS